MPTFLRTMEILSCSMAGYLPYILLLVYPHRNHLRLKGLAAGTLILLLTPVLVYCDISAALGTASASVSSRLLLCAAFLLFSLLAAEAPLGKVLLNTCSVVNLFVLIDAAAACFASAYTLPHLLITLLLQAALLIPYYLNLVKRLAPTLNCSDAAIWKLLWIAPAAGSAAAFVMLLAGASSATLSVTMAAAIILAAAVAAVALHKTKTEMITLILRKERPAKKAAPAAAAVSTPDPTELYLDTLQKRMEEAEFSCKELLLQVMTMEDDLNHEDYIQLRARLNTLRNQLAPDVPSCGNSHIDPIVAYYTRQAVLSNIRIVTNLELPELSSVSDEDMAVIIGCLMDCALSACREQTAGTRRIAAATNLSGDTLQIGIKNTHSEPMDPDCESLRLCRRIAARHGGKVSITGIEGVSQTVVTLTV